MPTTHSKKDATDFLESVPTFTEMRFVADESLTKRKTVFHEDDTVMDL